MPHLTTGGALSPRTLGFWHGLIVVVDDEPGLRDLLRVVLTRDGHQVQTAGDGHAALELLDAADDTAVLVTDLAHGRHGRIRPAARSYANATRDCKW